MLNLTAEKKNLNSALARVQNLVDYIFCEPINVGKLFGSSQLDKLCQEIGRLNLANLKKEKNESIGKEKIYPLSFKIPEKKLSSNINVYIASKLQVSGGHTAALIDVIRLSPPAHSIIIVTNNCGITNRNEIATRFCKLTNVILEYIPRGNHLAKLTWLQQRLIELAPDTVWLFNHHQDSVAVAAVQPNMGYKVKFYHHGDDRICLGVYLDFADHYDPHSFGLNNCRDILGIKNNRYLPLVAADQGSKNTPFLGIDKRRLTTCTVAGFNKVEVDYLFRYINVIPKLLKVTGGRHTHIGQLTRLALWHLRRGLRKLGIAPDSFIYIPYVPSVWHALHYYKVDVYISSFPYGAGRTMVEVMGAGVPIAIHSHCTNRMFGGIDMTYDGALLWRDPEELYAFLRNIDSELLNHHSKLARQWYETYHRDEIAQKILGPEHYSLDPPTSKTNYIPDPLMQALLVCHEVNLVSLVKRTLWRLYRRLKAILGRTYG